MIAMPDWPVMGPKKKEACGRMEQASSGVVPLTGVEPVRL